MTKALTFSVSKKENVLLRCETIPSIANLLVLEIFVPEVETSSSFSGLSMSRLKNWMMLNAGFLRQSVSQSGLKDTGCSLEVLLN